MKLLKCGQKFRLSAKIKWLQNQPEQGLSGCYHYKANGTESW